MILKEIAIITISLNENSLPDLFLKKKITPIIKQIQKFTMYNIIVS
jgi:hypothetical protein